MITVVGSLKGGSGKSTITFNMGIWLALADCPVVLVDADPQSTLSDAMAVRREQGFEPLVEVLGSDALADEAALRERGEVLIDVGTADMGALRRGVSIADRILAPVPPSQADIWSTQRFLHFVRSIRGSGDGAPEILGFINRGDTHHAVRETHEAAAALVSLPGLTYLKQRLQQRTAFRRSFSEGLAVFEMDPRGKGSMEWHAFAAAVYSHLL